MKKRSVIIFGAVLIILCTLCLVSFLNRKKDVKETGAFYNTSFQANGYTVEINSKQSGHPMEGSYFNTSFYTRDNKNYLHSYEVDIIELSEIAKKDVKDDGNFVKINEKKFYYFISDDNNNASLEYYAKVSGKRIVLKVKLTAMSVFDYKGNLTSEMSKVDEKVLSSEELASILNISISKTKKNK